LHFKKNIVVELPNPNDGAKSILRNYWLEAGRHIPEDLTQVLQVGTVSLLRIHVTRTNLLKEFSRLSEPRRVMMPLCKVGTALT